MRYTVQQIKKLFESFNESEIIHLWYRHKVDYEDPDEGEFVDDIEWSKLADCEGRIEDHIDEVMRDLIDDPYQRFDYES